MLWGGSQARRPSFFCCRRLLGELLEHVAGDLDGVVDAAGAAAERALIRSDALERSADGRRVLLAKALGDFARQLVGLALGLGVLHAVAHHKAHDGHGARDGTTGFGHAAHAGAEALGEGERGLGIESDGGRERTGDGLGAVKAAGVVFGSLSLTGGGVELGGINLFHRFLLDCGVPAYGTLADAFAH